MFYVFWAGKIFVINWFMSLLIMVVISWFSWLLIPDFARNTRSILGRRCVFNRNASLHKRLIRLRATAQPTFFLEITSPNRAQHLLVFLASTNILGVETFRSVCSKTRPKSCEFCSLWFLVSLNVINRFPNKGDKIRRVVSSISRLFRLCRETSAPLSSSTA